MLVIDSNNSIRLTRGDTAWFSITVHNPILNEEYEVGENDTLTLTVKKRATDLEPLVQKTIVYENIFHLEPEDTSDLAFGKYQYDVQITTGNGDVYTIIPPTSFEILKEVTY